MRHGYGGSLPLSEGRRHRLIALFDGWKHNKPDDPKKLAESIDRACAWVELECENFATDLTAREYRKAVEKYRDQINKAREALEKLPAPTEAIMSQNALVYNDPLQELRTDSLFQFSLTGPDALLRLLSDLAQDYLDQHAPELYKRQRYDLMKIRAVATVCREYGVTVGQADRGHFPSIIKDVLSTDDDDAVRDKIRQAFNMGKYSENKQENPPAKKE